MSVAVDNRSPVRPIGFRPADVSSLFHTRVIERHASEAGFLWGQRERAASAPHYKLKHLASLDERAHAHLQGLRIAGDVGWRAAMAALEQGEAGAVFVTGYLAFSSGDAEKMRYALHLAASEPAFAHALESALVWLELEQVMPPLRLLLRSATADHQRVAVAALAGHGVDPGDILPRAIESDDVRLRALALRVAGQFKRREMSVAVRSHTLDPDPVCQFWAGWSLALLGFPEGAPVALESGLGQSEHASRGVEVAMRCGARDWARETVRALASRPATLRLGIQAAGAFADPAVVPWLLRQVQEPTHARVAAEAFCTITGADLDYLGLKQDRPQEEPDESWVEDEQLPWPDPLKLEEWWNTQSSRYLQGQRYLDGQPISAASSVEVLRSGYQRRRRAAALELARSSETAPLFSVVDRADRQRKRLVP
jgi:uncharacterized protein (TIGR02270 family)